MKLTKQILLDLIKESMGGSYGSEERDCDSAIRCVDIDSLQKNPRSLSNDPDGTPSELIEMARCQGQKGKELPEEYNDGTGPIYAAWVEGYVEHTLWMDKCFPNSGENPYDTEGGEPEIEKQEMSVLQKMKKKLGFEE